MHNGASGICKPTVQVGVNDRVFISLGTLAPSLVGTRKEMQDLALQILSACGMPDKFFEGELQSCNEDIHPREVAR